MHGIKIRELTCRKWWSLINWFDILNGRFCAKQSISIVTRDCLYDFMSIFIVAMFRRKYVLLLNICIVSFRAKCSFDEHLLKKKENIIDVVDDNHEKNLYSRIKNKINRRNMMKRYKEIKSKYNRNIANIGK